MQQHVILMPDYVIWYNVHTCGLEVTVYYMTVLQAYETY